MMGAREGGVRPRLFLAVPLVCVGTVRPPPPYYSPLPDCNCIGRQQDSKRAHRRLMEEVKERNQMYLEPAGSFTTEEDLVDDQPKPPQIGGSLPKDRQQQEPAQNDSTSCTQWTLTLEKVQCTRWRSEHQLFSVESLIAL